ncbi:zinc finger protein 534 [Cephus cinctus]|uniref:Zinc finger protein 534 n=1 Tax=Cephus cinctus TaxID=211228 RepID=A0AAJ7C2Z6_CEPCN|nr:zinc finger protein 534 [Cephus cinctus]XP_024943434.1 zinc finger protein 534 [Cephus cinctus]
MKSMGQNIDEPNELPFEVKTLLDTEEDTKDVNNVQKKYKCTVPGCKYAFLRPSKLTTHMRNHTGERPYRCTYPNCDKTYTNSSHLKRHCETHDDIKQRYKCTKCFMLISNPHNLRRHYERWHHNKKQLTCEKCNVSFTSERQFKEHIAFHEGNALYMCNICKKQYNVYNRFRRHLRNHASSPKKYACPAAECSEIFEMSSLRTHIGSQHPEDYKCKHCGKVFLNSSMFQKHAAVHSETPLVFTCPYENCSRFYNFMRNLRQHIRTKHEDKLYQCDICNMKLCSRQKLIQHINNIHVSNKKKKSPAKGSERKRRKDAGEPKKSAVSRLSGLDLPRTLEKSLLQRETTRKLADRMAARSIKSLTSESLAKFFNSFDTVLTDCDGVLWLQMNPIPKSADVMNLFRNLGKKVFYITNNSTKTREEFVEKCKVLNFEASVDDILCTSNLAACYLQDLGFKKKVYVIGSTGITKELDRVGIPHIGSGPDTFTGDHVYKTFQKDEQVGAVIVGFDEHFSYPKMVKAATYLNDKNIHFIGTNTDERFPVPGSLVIPGTGSLVRSIETCAERKATIMGKPEPYVAQVVTKRYGVDPKRTLMIGDRCNTDILFGRRCGFKTLLVLSGVTTLDEVEKWKKSHLKEESNLVPEYYTETLGDLLPYLRSFQAAM